MMSNSSIHHLCSPDNAETGTRFGAKLPAAVLPASPGVRVLEVASGEWTIGGKSLTTADVKGLQAQGLTLKGARHS
jgi:hypothetical protein